MSASAANRSPVQARGDHASAAIMTGLVDVSVLSAVNQGLGEGGNGQSFA
jgi:hypothetical protein